MAQMDRGWTGVDTDADHAGAAENAIRQLERDWSAAYLRHDVKAIDRLLADDFVGTDGRGVMTTKADELQEAASTKEGAPASPFTTLEENLSDMKVRVYGDVAVLTSRNDMKAKTADREVTIVYRRTTVWTKRNGRWQCVAAHVTRG